METLNQYADEFLMLTDPKTIVGYKLIDGLKYKDEVESFLKNELGLPVHLVDERLTSYEAEASIPKSKRRDVRASGLIDSRAATLILQDFLGQAIPLAPPAGFEAGDEPGSEDTGR